jgi:beta-galactosidase
MEFPRFYFGADYYPEHWPEERWQEDAELMKAAGFNVVRMAEFAWSRLEPREGIYDFDWLDRAIEVLSARGIEVVLGTPTASPPPWLMAKQKDLFLVREDGVRLPFGLRREYCINNPLYHQYTEKIVLKMAEHFTGNPRVIGWQIDNEFGNLCYCDICQDEFQRWLQNRYGDLDTLNLSWGTEFWSHIYTDWTQIPVPLSTAVAHNPGLHLDYKRFMSDSFRAYQLFQINLIRKHTSEQFITHNLMGFGFDQLNYYDNSEDLDFVSWDNYKRMQWDMGSDIDHSSSGLSADTMRGLKKQNFWVMEQQSGGGGWNIVAVPPKPGELRLWTFQTIAHGADGLLYFRWRTCRTGTEQYWHGVLDHHGLPGRRYQETRQVGQELNRIGEVVLGSEGRSKAAIMQSYDTRFAFQIQPNNPRFKYETHIRDVYRGFFNHNIPVDIISEKDALDGYRLVIVPAMYILTEDTAANLERFADSGGVVVFTPRTGVKDQDNKVVNMKLPGLAAKMAGVEVEEYISMPVDGNNRVQFAAQALDDEFDSSVWADVLIPKSAKSIATYSNDFYSGRPAVTMNEYGNGTVIYLGMIGDPVFFDAFVYWISEFAGVSALLNTPPGVEVCERWQGNQQLLFILNHTERDHSISLDGDYINLIKNEKVGQELHLPSKDVAILTNV